VDVDIEEAVEIGTALLKDADTTTTTPEPVRRRKHTDFLVHNSNTYASSRSFANFTYCFPFLFPYGRGGYEEDRVVKLSEKAWFMRCLRIHGGAFQTHYGFIAMGYDNIATSIAFNAQYVAMRFSRRGIQAGLIDKATINLCLRYQAEIASNQRRGIKVSIMNELYR